MASSLAIPYGFLMRHRPSPSDEQQRYSDDLFRARLDQIIWVDHALVRLPDAMRWDSIVEQVADLLPPTPEGAGRGPLLVRMMVRLLDLKYAYNRSDDQVLVRWLESPYRQHSTGEVHFQYELPCDPSPLTRWCNRLDEAGEEELLAQTLAAAKTLKAIRPRELRVVSIYTSIYEYNIARPIDNGLLEVARPHLVERAAEVGIKLRQSYARIGPRLNRQAVLHVHAHARQYKRIQRAIRHQRTIVGWRAASATWRRLIRWPSEPRPCIVLGGWKSKRRRARTSSTLSIPRRRSPSSKGKAGQPYEFGVKASVAVTAPKGLIVGGGALGPR